MGTPNSSREAQWHKKNTDIIRTGSKAEVRWYMHGMEQQGYVTVCVVHCLWYASRADVTPREESWKVVLKWGRAWWDCAQNVDSMCTCETRVGTETTDSMMFLGDRCICWGDVRLSFFLLFFFLFFCLVYVFSIRGSRSGRGERKNAANRVVVSVELWYGASIQVDVEVTSRLCMGGRYRSRTLWKQERGQEMRPWDNHGSCQRQTSCCLEWNGRFSWRARM